MRLILLLLSLTYLLPLFAEDKSIDLDVLITDELRSFTDAPIVTYDGGAICILSDITIESFQVDIRNMNNEIVYSTIASIYEGQHYSFQFGNAECGTYKIVISTKDNTYYGFFELEKSIINY